MLSIIVILRLLKLIIFVVVDVVVVLVVVALIVVVDHTIFSCHVLKLIELMLSLCGGGAGYGLHSHFCVNS